MPTYIRLTDYKSSDEKEQGFFKPENRYEAKQEDFKKIPASPIAYWVSERVSLSFSNSISLGKIAELKGGMSTTDNEQFLRFWYEIEYEKINFISKNHTESIQSQKKWFPYNKGGGFRKWFGNNEYVVNWENDGYDIKECIASDPKKQVGGRIVNYEYYFKRGFTWSEVSTAKFSNRYSPDGFIFDTTGQMGYINDDMLLYISSLLNTKFMDSFLNMINPTQHNNSGALSKLPVILSKSEIKKQQIDTLTQQNIDISKEEWDSREISWDFTKNELIKHKSDDKIETAYSSYCNYWKEQFNTLHQNEEELNRLFIDIYALQDEDELTPDVELKDITILKNEAKIIDNELVFQADEIMKQFISYGVGVMFGRYSLESDGLLIANMNQEVPTDTTFKIDEENVMPVLEDEYFKDDIASRFVQFTKATFGEENLSENLRFIENSLGTPLRKYFVKGFYEDHIKRYKKRPIYWMVASPKKAFMSLIYMHRYKEDTFGIVRNSYLTEYIAKLEAHKETLTLTTTSDTASNKDKKDADKQMKNIETKLKEIIEFDRDKMMSWSQNPTQIDLDDGVKVNYCRFKEILYSITGLCK